MPDGMARALCPHCDKTVGVRPDQFGKPLRCPGCRQAFTFDPEPDAGGGEEAAPAADIGTLVLDRGRDRDAGRGGARTNGSRAKVTARYARPRELVFRAAVQAVRNSRCEVLSVDWANAHLRFALPLPGAGSTEHDLLAFGAADGATEVDVTSREPNEDGRFDPYYEGIVREVGKYLLFAAEAPPPAPAPAPLPPRRDRDEDDRPRYGPRYYHRRRDADPDGLGIAGFVCGLIGVCLSCLWFLGGPLGVLGLVFGLISFNSGRRGGKGFAVAGLTLGLVAIGLSVIFVIALAVEREREREELRRRLNYAPAPASRFANTHMPSPSA